MDKIKAGFAVFVGTREQAVGIVRTVSPEGRPELVIHIPGVGEFPVPFDEVEMVGNNKVILIERKLDRRILAAISDPKDAMPNPAD